jgi:ketosteroid isomerase-like protein
MNGRDRPGGDGPDPSGDSGPDPPEGRVPRVRAYYRALDAGDYELLAALLAPGFVHERPDMTLEGRERFVRFMREQRPTTDTTHPLDGVYRRVGSEEAEHGREDDDPKAELAARGRLLGPDGEEFTGFVDVFTFEGERMVRLRTSVD